MTYEQRVPDGPAPITNGRRRPEAWAASNAAYTVAEVAELLSLSTGSVYRLIRDGRVPARKTGTRWLIPRHWFHQWSRNQPEVRRTDQKWR